MPYAIRFVQQSPGDADGVEALMQSFNGLDCVGGGFIWTLDLILEQSSDIRNYSNAIITGLAATAGAADRAR